MTLSSLRRVLWILVAVAAIAAVAVAMGIIPLPKLMPIQTTYGVADVGGSFRLVTHKGTTLTDTDLKGRPFLVFFGFTHCPDVCPTTLMELTERYMTLGADADKLTTLFITVDPERDTQELLSQYMEAFDPRFIALRGSVDEIAASFRRAGPIARYLHLGAGGIMIGMGLLMITDNMSALAYWLIETFPALGRIG